MICQPTFTTCSQELLDTAIENVANFCVFSKALMPQGLWNGIFVEFGDNRLLSCTTVVGVNSRKGDRFGDTRT